MDRKSQHKDIFKKKAKTFYFASFFLGQKTIEKVSLLYAFCRFIDDIADETHDPHNAQKELEKIKKDIEQGESDTPFIQEFIYFADAQKLDKKYLTDLLDGVISDCKPSIRIKNEEALIHYCYQVAGTVGALMCPILNINQNLNKASPAAINLGIAMQLTNIARDIKDDAENNRVYIPQTWLIINEAKHFLSAPKTKEYDARDACKKLLDKSAEYYEKAKEGYPYLPFRERFTILVAANLYRSIGHQIEKIDHKYWLGRQHLTKFQKIIKTIKSAIEITYPSFWIEQKR